MKRCLFFVLILMIFLQSNKPAKADFGLTASIVGLGIGTGLVTITPFVEKKDDLTVDEENINEDVRDKNENADNDLPGRYELENLKDDLSKRWIR